MGLFGDSLVGVSESKYRIGEDIAKELENKHSEYEVYVSTSGENGNCAKDLLKRVDKDVINRSGEDHAPDAVIILFDSDAADVESADEESTQKMYKATLSELVEKVKHNVDYVALAGPILFGELKKGRNERDEIMDDYDDINQMIADKYEIPYIPLRRYFFEAEKKSVHAEEQKEGKLTVDGEHPLHPGEEIIEEHLLKQILAWKQLWRPRASDEMESSNIPFYLQPLFGLFNYVGLY